MLTDEPRPGSHGERRRHLRLRAVFDTALQHDPSDRDRYLDEACAGDDELLHQVKRLLAAHAEARTFLEWPRPSLDEAARELFRQRIPPVDQGRP